MAKTDGLTFINEIAPVAGYDDQKIKGGIISDAIEDKLLSIPGELLVGVKIDWKIVNTLTIRNKIIVNVGVSAVGGSFSVRIKQNGSFISVPLAIPSGVRVMEFSSGVLTSPDFNKGDVLTVEVVSVSGSRSGYHLTVQFDYSY